MSHLPHFPFARRALFACLLSVPTLTVCSLPAHGQSPPAQETAPPAQANPPQAQPAKPQEANSTEATEMSSRDTAPTFKVRVNLVLVRVVVRDPKGNVVPGLHKEDFQLSDNRKLQIITTFSVETPASHAIAETSSIDTGNSDAAAASAAVRLCGFRRPAPGDE
jgi:hypothetical protein